MITEAGKRLLDEWFPSRGDGLDAIELHEFRLDIAAIEAEAVAAERARLRAAVEGLPTIGFDKIVWTGGQPVRRAAVLALLEPAP